MVVFVLAAAGLGLRVRLVNQGLWGDEQLAYDDIHGKSLIGVLNAVSEGIENSPPLYFILARLTSALGNDPALLRLPSIALGTATVPLVYLLGVSALGRWASVAGAGFVSLSPFAIYYSVEARPYAALMFFCALSALCLLAALQRGGTRWWVAWGLSLGAVIYTHYTGVFVVGAEVLWALWARPAARREVLFSAAFAAATFLPWLPSVKGEQLEAYSQVATILGITYPGAVVSWTIGLPFLKPEAVPGVAALILLASAVTLGVLGGTRTRDGSIRSKARSPAGLLSILAAITPAAVLIYSLVSDDLFLFPRNLIASLPFAALVLGWALVRPGWPRAVVPVALAATAVVIGALKAEDIRFSRPDYVEAAHFVDKVTGRGDRVLYPDPGLDANNLDRSLRLYYRRTHAARFVMDPAEWKTALGSSRLVVVAASPIGEPGVPLPTPPGLVKVDEREFAGIRRLEVAVYALDRLSGPHAYRLERQRLVPAVGAPIPIREQGVEGIVDASQFAPGGMLQLSGWAHVRRRPVARVVGFAGRRLVYAGVPSVSRPDVAGPSGSGEALGFEFSVPRGALRQADRAVAVYAVADGVAVRLEYWCEPQAEQVVGCRGSLRP
ncbi:MAG: glycosyltransferase family 39 protein [Thermoleophilaceae bacterium]|nr:glycosyltransferase family 39 protein [Thermoleophilaceae bacterium]